MHYRLKCIGLERSRYFFAIPDGIGDRAGGWSRPPRENGNLISLSYKGFCQRLPNQPRPPCKKYPHQTPKQKTSEESDGRAPYIQRNPDMPDGMTEDIA